MGRIVLKRFRIAQFVGGTALVSVLLSHSVAAQDAAFGKTVWLTQAPCAECHGWMGDGNSADPRQPRGANLRETQLDVDGIVQIVLCGIPGTAMPAFDPKAYSDDRCGMTAEQVGDQRPEQGSAKLTKRHATGLANFILENFAGKGPATKQKCVAELGDQIDYCNTLPEG